MTRPLHDDRARLLVHRAWRVLVGFWFGGMVGRFVVWALDLDGTPSLVAALASMVLGAALGVVAARELDVENLPPARPHLLRDAAVGFGAILALPVALVVGAAVGMPWGPVAGVGVVALVLAMLFVVATARPVRRG